MSYFMPISMSTLSRLENMPAPPTSRRSRAVAAIYALVLGYEPAAFGLEIADLPPSITEDRLADLDGASFRCSMILAGAGTAA